MATDSAPLHALRTTRKRVADGAIPNIGRARLLQLLFARKANRGLLVAVPAAMRRNMAVPPPLKYSPLRHP